MTIIQHTDRHVCASFKDPAKGQAFYDSLPDDVRANYTIKTQEIEYPYYYIWTWDLRAGYPRDESKDEIRVVTARELEQFCKAYKRDPEIEKTENWDDQYFYVGVIGRDGVVYGLRKALGWPTGPGHSEELSMLFDHHHMDWYLIAKVKCEGVHRAFMYYHDRIEYRKARFAKRRLRRYSKLQAAGKLSPKAVKKANRFALREMRAVFGKPIGG